MNVRHLISPVSGLALTAVFVAMGLGFVPAAQATPIYSNNFETNTNGFTISGDQSPSTDIVTLPTDNGGFDSSNTSQYLGEFSNTTATLSLTGLAPNTTYNVAFNLFIGLTWDGNLTGVGPDDWTLTADGTSLVDTTFSNGYDDGTQNYSDSNPTGSGSYSSRTGADVTYINGYSGYSIYYFGHGAGNPTLSFTATGSTATLIFSGSNLQGVGDEFWALDNVVISTGATPPPTSVPEPGTLLLFGFGLGLLGFFVKKRWNSAKR